MYNGPEAMEPLLPQENNSRLAELSRDIWVNAGELSGQLSAARTKQGVANLVRNMNSYYSNLIEGHKTFPRDIEKALAHDFSGNAKERNNQALHIAHIQVDELLRSQMGGNTDPFSKDFLCWIHREFYTRLPDEFRWSETASGKKYPVVPGEIRDYNVDVYRHTPPDHEVLNKFLTRFQEFYAKRSLVATEGLIVTAAAHHRLAWIHPFGDGNGRVARLFSHALLIRNKVDADGLWTISRGLARNRQKYYATLGNADRKRDNDYDGRGNLSQNGLFEFCEFFLQTALDQIVFMKEILQLNKLEDRICEYAHRSKVFDRHEEEGSRLLVAVLREGEVSRGRATEITGKSESFNRKIFRQAFAAKLLESDTPKGALHLGFPKEVWDWYFPKLFLDLRV